MEFDRTNFIHQIIDEELKEGGRVHGQEIITRFPPEPNGFLHIGHAKAINLDFATARIYGGKCNLRMDDTNPLKEENIYVKSIKEDVKWLGFDWEDRLYFASDYFDEMYKRALLLIRKSLAYVDDLSPEEMRLYRGSLTEPGKESPFRNRSIEENLDLFQRMKDGEFPDGSRTLRAKIDMASGNMNMRDPVIYRISHTDHHRQGSKWCIYPMYDFAHPLEDAIEGITHSLCTLEFEDHRPLYDWFVKECEMEHVPRQIEFARLNLTYTVMSKRKLRSMVEEGLVDGWDDPRLPTLQGLRRRGYTPESIISFSNRIGIAKTDSTVDMQFLEYCLREDLDERSIRAMAVIDPVKLIIDNYPEGKEEECTIKNHPKKPEMGNHTVKFSREVWIEREDFMIDPPKKYFRLFPGNEVRLQGAYVVKCTDYKTDSEGNVIEVHAEYDPDSFGGMPADSRRIKGTIHWVPVNSGIQAEIHLYDRLFSVENPDADERDYHELINPDSLKVIKNAYIEPFLAENTNNSIPYQFMRKGYFILDSKLSSPEKPVFNMTVNLRDSYKPQEKK